MDLKKAYLNFLSAGDRNNYGDFLFPLIANRILSSKHIIFNNYGLVKSNFQWYGALPTRSYRNLQKDIQKNDVRQILLVGGGEVFFVSWTDLYRYINSLFSKLMSYRRLREFANKHQIAKNILSGSDIRFPYTPRKQKLNNPEVKIVYNSVGGTFRDYFNSSVRNILIESLQDADYISVRDEETKKSFQKNGINSVLTPDSALIMSDLFNRSAIKKKTPWLNSLYDQDYMVFQISKNYWPKNLELIVNKINDFSSLLKLKVILCPIGLAKGHEDQILLKNLQSQQKNFIYHQPKSLFDIMGLIAHSRLFVGTSLHGLITAQSFEVPFIRYNSIRKTEAFMKTWHKNLENITFIENDIQELQNTFLNWNYSNQKLTTKVQKKMVYKNFGVIMDLL